LAHGFADILQVASAASYESKLAPCLTSLVRDKHEQVREAMVARLVDVARSLGSSEYFRVITDFCTALTDESPLVISTAVGQLELFLNLFIRSADTGSSTSSSGNTSNVSS